MDRAPAIHPSSYQGTLDEAYASSNRYSQSALGSCGARRSPVCAISMTWQLRLCAHPGCVWDVDFLPNGDLITACADHVVRLWTSAPERAAAAGVIEAYSASLAAEASPGQPTIACCWPGLTAFGPIGLRVFSCCSCCCSPLDVNHLVLL